MPLFWKGAGVLEMSSSMGNECPEKDVSCLGIIEKRPSRVECCSVGTKSEIALSHPHAMVQPGCCPCLGAGRSEVSA